MCITRGQCDAAAASISWKYILRTGYLKRETDIRKLAPYMRNKQMLEDLNTEECCGFADLMHATVDILAKHMALVSPF